MSSDDERRSRNIAIVREMLAEFSAGNQDGQLAHVTDDVIYEAPYYPEMEPRRGKDQLRSMLENVEARFSSVSYEIAEWFPTVDPDLVIVEVRGNNQVRDSTRRYRNHYVMFLRFRGDLVAEWKEYSNPNTYREAVG